MHRSIDKKNILLYLFFFITLCTINNKSLEIKKIFSTEVIKFNVLGLSKSNNLAITNKLHKLLPVNIFFINKDSVDQIMSEYNLIEKYHIKKIYPKYLQIDIEPTKFLAKINGEESFLVGSNGKLIINQDTNKDLPFLFGKFDSEKFLEFKKAINDSEFQFKNFKSIFFFPSSRWDVKTINNVLIKLPVKDISKALKIAYKITTNDHLNHNTVIDLRIPNHIILKK